MTQKREESPQRHERDVVSAINTFHTDVDGLDASYRTLQQKITTLNVELKERNRQLEESLGEVTRLQHFLTSILNSMTDAVIVVDISRKIVFFNECAEHMTAYPKSEVMNHSYADIFGKAVPSGCSLIHTLNTGHPVHSEEKLIKTKHGQTLPVRFSTALIKTDENRVLGALEMMHDLTRIKRLEKAMQLMKTHVALNQMASLVAHEIRTPLGGIRGYVDLLSESLKDDPEKKEQLEHIIQSVNRLNTTATKFQEFARPVKPQFDNIDLIEFTMELTAYFKTRHDLSKAGIQMQVNIPPRMKTLTAHIDQFLIEQSLLAILENSIQAMPKGGTLDLELKEQKLNDEKQAFSFIVTDTGIGMDPDTLDQVFTPFFSTRDSLGLSLAAAHNFITLHQGDILIESEKNKGTTVTITIPLN